MKKELREKYSYYESKLEEARKNKNQSDVYFYEKQLDNLSDIINSI